MRGTSHEAGRRSKRERRRKRMVPALVGLSLSVGIHLHAQTPLPGADRRLVDAARGLDVEGVRAALAAGEDVDRRQPDGATALHWAAYRDDADLVALLLDAGADPTLANDYGVTPLTLACGTGNPGIVHALLAAGANAAAAVSTGETVLMACARTGSAEAVRALLRHGANVNAREPTENQTALMWAVARGHVEVVKVLIESGADVRARSRAARHVISRRLQSELRYGELGRSYGTDAEETQIGGFTPLLFAARHGDVEAARLLLEAGAEVDDVAPDGATALVIATFSGHRELPLFLLERGANPNAAGAGYTALHAAVLTGDEPVVAALLAAGARPDAQVTQATRVTRNGQVLMISERLVGATPLALAAKTIEVELMRRFVDAGADARLPLRNGWTPLMLAAGASWRHGVWDRRDRVLPHLVATQAELVDEGENARRRRAPRRAGGGRQRRRRGRQHRAPSRGRQRVRPRRRAPRGRECGSEPAQPTGADPPRHRGAGADRERRGGSGNGSAAPAVGSRRVSADRPPATLTRPLGRDPRESRGREMSHDDTTGERGRSRRRFLKAATLGTAGTAATVLGSGSVVGQEPTGRALGGAVGAYGERSPFASPMRRARMSRHGEAAGSLTPIQDLRGTITPSALHFERHHAGIPAIDPAEHELLVDGLVDRPLVFSMDAIERMPAVSRIYFLECSGNGRVKWSPAQPETDAQAAFGMMSCSEWTGVPLSVLLQEAGVRPGASWVVAEGGDACRMTRSVPLDKALDDVLVAYGQNGEALRPAQGYPLRLLVPGWEGNISIKWLRRLMVVDKPFMTREETSKYTDLMPNGEARQFTFVMDAKSVITRPSGGQHLSGPGFHQISGLAWSGRGRVSRVDVSLDGGRTWRPSQLQNPVLPLALTRFRLDWTWDGSETTIASRCVDETGDQQPTREALVARRGLRSSYHNNVIQGWRIRSNGEVENVEI